MAKEAKAETVFVTPFGLLQFNIIPFGLQGAPSTFQRLMDRVIQGLQDYTATYLDDLIIFSRCWTDHLKHLSTVLQWLGEAGLTVKPTKCHAVRDGRSLRCLFGPHCWKWECQTRSWENRSSKAVLHSTD